MKQRVLLVEDDIELNHTITEFLIMSNFDVVSAYDGDEALNAMYESNFDVVLLDIKLPKMNGFDVAKEIRRSFSTPIIFITSLDGETNVVKAFLNGGDDYIRKPFSLKELKVRIDAILRRVYGSKDSVVKVSNGIEFDLEKLELYKNGERVKLKTKELKLLKLFLQNKGRVLSKGVIFDNIYDYYEEPNEYSLRTFINNLRRVIGKDKIETVKNTGYRYVG